MNKPLILLLLSATVLAGCSRDDTPEHYSKGVEIHFILPQIEQQKADQHLEQQGAELHLDKQGEPLLARKKASDKTKAYTSVMHLDQQQAELHLDQQKADQHLDKQGTATRNAQSPATRALLDERATVRVVAYKAVAGTTTPQTANYVAEQTYVADAEGRLTPCTVNADGSFAAATPDATLRLIAGNYDFFAITPALPLDAAQTAVNVPNGTDYATSRTANVEVLPAENTKNVALTQLQRQTARIILMVQKDPDYSLNLLQIDTDPTKQGVVLDGLAPTLSGAVLGATLTQGTGATGNNLTFPASKFTQTDATTVTLTTCVLPRTATDIALSYDLILGKLVSGIQTNTQMSLSGTVPDISLVAGNSYRFILTLSPTSAILSLDSWDNGGDTNNDLGN